MNRLTNGPGYVKAPTIWAFVCNAYALSVTHDRVKCVWNVFTYGGKSVLISTRMHDRSVRDDSSNLRLVTFCLYINVKRETIHRKEEYRSERRVRRQKRESGQRRPKPDPVELHPSVQKGIILKRTKATYTIVEGIGREESLDIIDVLKNQTFSILLDESTDVSVTQMLALVVRYVNANIMQTVDRCFDIIEVLDGTSLELFKAVSNVLFEKHSIPPKNLIGLGADNCATIMGKVSGFQAQLKEACPHIFVNGCICHSLALCLSHGSKKLPAWIENFIRDICSYFSHSSKRKQKFKNIQKLCDDPRHAILKIA